MDKKTMYISQLKKYLTYYSDEKNKKDGGEKSNPFLLECEGDFYQIIFDNICIMREWMYLLLCLYYICYMVSHAYFFKLPIIYICRFFWYYMIFVVFMNVLLLGTLYYIYNYRIIIFPADHSKIYVHFYNQMQGYESIFFWLHSYCIIYLLAALLFYLITIWWFYYS